MIIKSDLLLIRCLLFLSFSFSQINTERMRNNEKKIGFSNNLKFEFGYEKSKEKIFNNDINYRLDYNFNNTLRSFFIFNYENSFRNAENKKDVYLNRGFGHLRLTKSLIKNFDAEIFFQVGFNEFLDIKDRKLGGSGLRLKIMDQKAGTLFLGLGLMKENEKYNPSLIPYKSLIRSTNYLNLKLHLTSNIYYETIGYVQPSLENFNDFRILIDNNIDFQFTDNFNLTINIHYRYDNEPHGDMIKTYFQIKNGFELSF